MKKTTEDKITEHPAENKVSEQPKEEEINQDQIKELTDIVKRLQAEYDAIEYQRDRLYQDMREQLDLLFHDMTAGKGDKTGEWYKAVKKVKDDTPKS